MKEQEAKTLITQLSFAYSSSVIAKDKNVAKYYLDKFMNMQYKALSTSIDMLIDTNKNLPKISEIMEVYKSEYKKHEGLRKAFNIKCDICDSKGFILDRQILDINSEGKGKEYIYALHCTCELGNKYANDMYSVDSRYNTKDIIAKRERQRNKSNKPSKAETIAKINAMLGGKI